MSTVSPESDHHPEHRIVSRVGHHEVPVRPEPGSGYTAFVRRRACRRAGGHWAHPLNGMGVDWFCCQCGTLLGPPKAVAA